MPASPQRGYGQTELRLSIGLLRGAMPEACAVLLSHVWSVRVVEKSDFAHARARVRNPLDKVLRKCIDSAFLGFSARAGRPEEANPGEGPYPKGKSARARVMFLKSGCLCSGAVRA